MNRIILKDLFRYEGERCKSIKMQLRYLLFTPSFRYKNKLSRLFWHFMLMHWMLKTGIQIPWQTKIGDGFRIVHFGHIVVNPNAIIGKNFNI